MLKQQSPSNVDRVVRPFKIRVYGTPGGHDLPDDRTGGQPETPADASRLAVPLAEADRATGWWSAVLLFFMEGFALYGAALYPITAFSVEIAPTTALARSPRPIVRGPRVVTHEQSGSQPSKHGNVVELQRAAWADPRPRRRWSWWAALGETVAVLLTHWRRERAIKRAVAALNEYDERTLRDLGIHGRADIERVVRHCRDC